MTTVACSLVTKSMAADSQCSQGRSIYRVSKIIRLKNNGGLLSTAGSRYLTGAFEAEFKRGVTDPAKPEVPDGEDEFEALWLRPDGIWLFDCSFYSERIAGDFAAIGTGGSVAMSHLFDGLTPEQAVLRACRVDPNSSAPVHNETLGA